MVNMKTCSKCDTPRPLCEFGKRLKNKDGLKGQCYKCCNAAEKKRNDQKGAEKARWHKLARGDRDVLDGIPKRMCPRCKRNKPWVDYPAVTRKNQGVNFMCDACRRIAEEARSRKARRKINQKRCRERYYAQLKADALSWQNHMRSRGIIWNAGIRKDAVAWREYVVSHQLTIK